MFSVKSGQSSALLLRLFGCALVLALLSACGGQPGGHAGQDADYYRSHARRSYTPPGPPGDPWGPYVQEAAKRYDVPEFWIREVMQTESGGNLYRNGELITSPVGAMGLMQVMPGTYEELRDRHALGDDPYDPHNNILAGTAYLREMYDIYGSPGFLAAYNAGPKRLDDYLANQRDLPLETRRYVARIAPNIAGIWPDNRSQAEQYAMNTLPANIPPGLRYARGRTQLAQARDVAPRENTARENAARGNAHGGRGEVRVAQLPPPVPAPAPLQNLAASPPRPASSRFALHLIPSATAAPVAPRGDGGGVGQWAVQVGAFSNEHLARNATSNAQAQARDSLGRAQSQISGVRQGNATLYRARLVGLSQSAAIQACQRLQHSRATCVVVSPDARS